MTKITKKELEFQLNSTIHDFLTAENAEYCLVYLKYYPEIYAGSMQPDDSGLSLKELLYVQEKFFNFFRLITLASTKSNHVGPIMEFKELKLSEEIQLPELFFDGSTERISLSGTSCADWTKIII